MKARISGFAPEIEKALRYWAGLGTDLRRKGKAMHSKGKAKAKQRQSYARLTIALIRGAEAVPSSA